MDTFANLPDEEKKVYFEQTAARMGYPDFTIEKDFWVCWTLKQLFSLPEWGEHLTFKGGTSLSKAWKLIERFSEDIDLVIDQEFLGLKPETTPSTTSSGKKNRKLIDQLKLNCQKQVKEDLLPTLQAHFSKVLTDSTWTLMMADEVDDPDQQSILFRYPTLYPDAFEYVGRDVKLEFGARSDPEPSELVKIMPYLADITENDYQELLLDVCAVKPERTFLEKAMLIHEINVRKTDKKLKPRLSRHYYDLYKLIESGVGDSACQDTELTRNVADHRSVYFKYGWINYDDLKEFKLTLQPPSNLLTYWQSDYTDMQQMFAGEVPEFSQILDTIDRFMREREKQSHG